MSVPARRDRTPLPSGWAAPGPPTSLPPPPLPPRLARERRNLDDGPRPSKRVPELKSRATVATFAVFASAVGYGASPGAEAAPPPGWRPDVAAARAYLAERGGQVSFAVRTERRM